MGGATRAAITAFLCLSLWGCSTRLVINVSGPLQQPVISPERRAGPVCLSSLTIHSSSYPGPEERVVWKIEGRDGACVRFASLVYGQAPQGFVELIPAAPLDAGIVYSAFGRGDIRGPLGAIWAGGGAYVFSDGAWRTVSD